MKRIAPILFACAVPLLAQTTIKDALIKHWKVAADFTSAVASAMPEESFGFRPVPEEMSFGQLMVHIAAADMFACQAASGRAMPTLSPKIAAWAKDQEHTDIDKATAVPFIADAFKFCNDLVESMTPETLDKKGKTMTGFEMLWAYFTHTAHHRGQAEVYLRLKGIKPPEYKF